MPLDINSEQINLIKLHDIIVEFFNTSEIKDICFRMNLDYDELPLLEGKSNTVRELLAYLNRRNRVIELIKIGEIIRPDIKWDDLAQPNNDKHKITTAHVSVTFTPLPLDRGFIGREEELEIIAHRLENFPVVLIEGISGIGKTSLLARYINRNITSSNDSVFWLECHEGTELNDIFGAFFDYARKNDDLEIETAVQEDRPTSDRIHSLISILDSRASYLCFDGFENADDKSISPLVGEFIEHCEHAKLIICTRERPKSFFHFLLDLGEIILGGFNEVAVSTMLEHLKINYETATLHNLLAIKTEGHPLAIKLFASLVRNYGLDIEELLTDSPEFGQSLEKHWLSKIYTKLSRNEQDLLERISIYIDPIEKEGIRKVSASQNWTKDFYSLQDKFLLNQTINSCFSMHSLIREFCYQKLEERNLLEDSAQLAADFYLKEYSLDEYNRELSQDEVSNKLKAHHYLITAGNFNLAAKIVHNIQHILMTWARYSQLLSLIQISLDTVPDYEGSVWFKYYEARILYIQGDLENSRKIFDRLSKESDQNVAAESIQMLANLYLDQKKTDEVMVLFENNLSIFRHKAKSQQRMLDKVARVYIDNGKIDQAIQIYNQILHWHQASEDQIGAAVTLRQLAIIYSSKHDFQNAFNLLELAQQLAIDAGDKRLTGWIDSTRGELHEKNGSLSLAIECYEKALANAIKIDNRVEIIGLSSILYKHYEHQGNNERCLFLSRLIDDPNLNN